MIIDLSFDSDVTTDLEVLETSSKRKQGIRQVIERAEVKYNIELLLTAECFRAGEFKFT
jgi:hypothetical protein